MPDPSKPAGEMNESEELLDIEKAARFLKVSETSLRRWTNAGRLPCLRVGRRRERRFRRSDLVAFLEEQPGTARTTSVAAETATNDHVLEAGTHLCGLYGSELGRLKMSLSFVSSAEPGSVTFVLTDVAARETIRRHLQEAASRNDGDEPSRVVLADYQESGSAQLDYFATELTAAMRAGAKSLRVLGDVTCISRSVEPEEVVEYELSYDELIAQRFPVVTLCQYDVRAFPGLALLNALKCHPHTLRHAGSLLLA